MKDKSIIEDLKACGASVRLINAISAGITLNIFPYRNLSEVPSIKIDDVFFNQLKEIPNLGKKSAIEFVKISRNYKLAQSALSATKETIPTTKKLPKLEILKALELRGASERLKEVLISVIESGELEAKFLNELPVCVDGSVSYMHILKLRHMGKKNADEFLSIVDSFMADNQLLENFEIKIDSLRDRLQFTLGFDFKNPEKLIANSPSTFIDLLLKAKRVQRVLFLADRRELVRQAMREFKTHLPNESVTRIEGGETSRSRIQFATYPSMMQVYEKLSIGTFDLIIADESHRSIYQRYKAIFDHFDAIQLVTVHGSSQA